MSDMRYGGKSLATEAVGCHRVKILVLAKFGRCEPVTEDRQVGVLGKTSCRASDKDFIRKVEISYPDASPVILNLEELEATIFDRHLNRRRACVERVFEELLEGIGWSLNDLGVAGCERVRV